MSFTRTPLRQVFLLAVLHFLLLFLVFACKNDRFVSFRPFIHLAQVSKLKNQTISVRAIFIQTKKLEAEDVWNAYKHDFKTRSAPIIMLHPHVFVAQTTAAHINHFYRAIIAANEYPGPAVINVYTPCQPEHGIADNMSIHQAKLAVDSRTFPLLTYDPRKGETIASRLSLQGNPATHEDWFTQADGKVIDFVQFAKTEGRFAKQFDKEGNPSPELLNAQQDRLKNWHLLQELAGIR